MKDEQTLRKYLLGNMPVEEQEDIELWLMSDEEAYDLLEAAEDDLVDDALRGELKGPDLDQFNTHFLIAPERKGKLQFSRSLHRFIDSRSVPEPSSFWATVRASLHLRPSLVYAVSALIIVIVIGGVWSARKQAELQQRLDSTLSVLAETSRQRDELQKQLKQAQTATEDVRRQVRGTPTVSAPKPTLLAVNLIPNLTRTASNVPVVAITGDTRFVQFSLALLDDNYSSYRVSLRNAGGKELWSEDHLTSMVTANGKAVMLVVPGNLLVPADYNFVLSGISDSQPPENINTFLFRIARRPS